METVARKCSSLRARASVRRRRERARVAGGGAREASSEGSLAEGTPDTDDSGAEPRRARRRAGGRASLRTRPADDAPAPPAPPTAPHVAALEVQNVKRAINRYGTLPKGARIGAYLESLRQSGGQPAPPDAAPHDEARSLSPRTARAQPHMIRSNSSGGVTAPAPASPRAARADPPLRSFAGSPAKPRPRLADLEFPPPPPDLPPPPEDAQPPPPPPDCCREPAPASAPAPADERPARLAMKEMLELKLVAEIKERADKKHKLKDSPPEPEETPAAFGDPVTRLVSELSESLNLEALRRDRRGGPAATPAAPPAPAPVDPAAAAEPPALSPGDLKAGLRKTGYSNKVEMEPKTSTDFKSQLKKVDINKANHAKDEETCAIIDFKSRLRKVDSGSPATNGTAHREAGSPGERDGERKHSESGSLEASGGDEEDKRRSTGSIGSLKRLWESKEGEERLSPKPKSREESAETSPEERGAGAGVARSSSVQRREERPAVPSKPAVRGRPLAKGGIYATPLAPAPAAAGDADDADALAALRTLLEACTAEVSFAFIRHHLPMRL